jgi:hypothetical protein
LRHVAGCDRCQGESDDIAANAAQAARLLSSPARIGDIDRDWALLEARLREPGPARHRAGTALWSMRRRLASASLGTSAAVVGTVLALGAAAAATLTTIYAPTHVAPVRVGRADVLALANLTGLGPSQLAAGLPQAGSRRLAFGELTWTTAGRARQVSSIGRAIAITHLTWSRPAKLPTGVSAPRSIAIQPQVTATLRFNKGAGPGIAGSALRIVAGPAVIVQYGNTFGQAGLPTLAVAVMKRPVASSTGATASELVKFLTGRRGVPAGLARELRLLGNPATTLPIPVPAGLEERQVRIGGMPAVLVTAPLGVASAVIWESRSGVVFGVAGLLDNRDILSVARQVG